MITHLQLEFLRLGALPIYDVENNSDFGRRFRYYHLDEDQKQWSIRETCQRRLMISTEIDTMVEILEPQLRQWLRMIDDEPDGTLFFPVRSCGSLADTGTLILAGAAFVPNNIPGDYEAPREGRAYGKSLEGADPTQLIVETARSIEPFMQGHLGSTPLELMVDLEGRHPIVADAIWGAAMARIEREREDERKETVEERSRTLLHEFLDDEQRAELAERRQFRIEGADGHTYLIRKGHGHNVFRVEGGERTIEYCLVCKGWVPVYDLMLTQMLLLQTDPGRFIETANIRELKPRSLTTAEVFPILDALAGLDGPVRDPVAEGLEEDRAARE
jgi:hypothetical protein